MIRVLLLSLLIGASQAWVEDTRFEATIYKGTWVSGSINFDDRDEMQICKLDRYQMIGCYCELNANDAEDNRWCDGNWIMWNEQTGDLECHSYTNADTESYIRAVAVCQQTVIYPMEPNKDTRLGTAPSVSCPENYQMMDCWMHADVIDVEFWQNRARLVKSIGENTCTVENCVACRVQASCLIKDIVTAPSLDTFPYPPEVV